MRLRRRKCRTSFRGRSVSRYNRGAYERRLDPSRPAQRGSALACFSNSGFKFKYVLPTASVRAYGPTSPRLSDVSIPVRPPVTGVSPEWPELGVVKPTDLPAGVIAAPLMADQSGLSRGRPNCTNGQCRCNRCPTHQDLLVARFAA
jgi:hypothetical protein